ncbi:class I SAM-dependent methyltransferase [Ensifer sp. SL37]|uniref:class I SAM-dependent methyltransferase n=1 Tax=Ensifer sp. SL37 TaxID=2995137 RepID=UPI0022736758|nr:class I SAM-dependent methyltransferase [Ensifer sp. SL37]MCY1740366.1 class I SAM-dependent methyltransferase [Ensifer sp. SL37]
MDEISDDQRWWLQQVRDGYAIQLEYPVLPKLRRLPYRPINKMIAGIISGHANRYEALLSDFQKFNANFAEISDDPSNEGNSPTWRSNWMPALDAISLYAFAAQRNAANFIEIGSGTSTTFVRQAIQDHNLRTKIISIDPHPRRDIDMIVDVGFRRPLEDADLSIFDEVMNGDIVFFDGSHRSFQNTDVTVFFTEIVPRLLETPNVLVGVHDVFLPYDYPQDWLRRHYNEQYRTRPRWVAL